jgi:hypothetical protein
MGIQAVLTGDIVNSTKLLPAAERKLLKILHQVLAPHRFEFYRGDSFQACIQNAGEALQTALLCRTAAISISRDKAAVPSDVRLSIGIGKTKIPVKILGAAKGEAFILSGRTFDEITKTGARLAIATTHQLANEGLQVIAGYINALFTDMTAKQAGVIFEMLQGQTQQAVAAKLKKSRSTINQHVSAGRWPEIEKLLQQYKNIINHLI